MSVEHIVWLRFKEGVSRERIEQHMANLHEWLHVGAVR